MTPVQVNKNGRPVRARKPQVRYAWVTVRPGARSKKPPRVECHWSLYGANGEHMCGSFPEGYRDKTDARRAVQQATAALSGTLAHLRGAYREVGPGPKPAL